MALLEIRSISKRFSGLLALNDVSFDVEQGQITGLIGPNGAGKTTLTNVITGFDKPTGGKIIFQGKDISGLKPSSICKRGIARTFQLTNVFRELSVLKSVCVAFHLHSWEGWLGTIFNTPAAIKKEAKIEEKAIEILEFFGITHVKNELSKNLPQGYERLVGVAGAMATGAELLILDEPVTGMNPTEVKVMMDLLNKVKDRGNTILLIEHNMKVVMGLCDKIVAINFGRKIGEGTTKEIQANENVIEAYLGVNYE